MACLAARIDFAGQRAADRLVRLVLIAAACLSFVLGFALRSLAVTLAVFAGCTLALSLVVLPPWPMFNRHPVQWLPAE